MPIVDIKGVGKAEFPDDMTTEEIRNFLQYKYPVTTGDRPSFDRPADTISPVEKSLAQRGGQAVSDFLYDNKIVSDRYGAQRIGQNLSTLGEFLPVVGDATAAVEVGFSFSIGD